MLFSIRFECVFFSLLLPFFIYRCNVLLPLPTPYPARRPSTPARLYIRTLIQHSQFNNKLVDIHTHCMCVALCVRLVHVYANEYFTRTHTVWRVLMCYDMLVKFHSFRSARWTASSYTHIPTHVLIHLCITHNVHHHHQHHTLDTHTFPRTHAAWFHLKPILKFKMNEKCRDCG